jgi:hypothetical protein
MTSDEMRECADKYCALIEAATSLRDGLLEKEVIERRSGFFGYSREIGALRRGLDEAIAKLLIFVGGA